MGGVKTSPSRNYLMVTTIQEAEITSLLLPCSTLLGVIVNQVPYKTLLCVLIAGISCFCSALEARAAYVPKEMVATATRLSKLSLDNRRSFAANGQQLDREGLLAQFAEGDFYPIIREDGRISGLVFEGKGRLNITIPEGVETAAWQATTNFAPWEQEFTGAYLRFSDATLDDLQGIQPMEEGAGTAGSFRIYNARSELLATPEWTRWHPGLIVDQLMDLYGGGHVGGHLLAEFRLSKTNPGGWLLSLIHI